MNMDAELTSSRSHELLAKGQQKWGDAADSVHGEESGRKGRYREHLALIHTLRIPYSESRDYPHDFVLSRDLIL